MKTGHVYPMNGELRKSLARDAAAPVIVQENSRRLKIPGRIKQIRGINYSAHSISTMSAKVPIAPVQGFSAQGRRQSVVR